MICQTACVSAKFTSTLGMHSVIVGIRVSWGPILKVIYFMFYIKYLAF